MNVGLKRIIKSYSRSMHNADARLSLSLLIDEVHSIPIGKDYYGIISTHNAMIFKKNNIALIKNKIDNTTICLFYLRKTSDQLGFFKILSINAIDDIISKQKYKMK